MELLVSNRAIPDTHLAKKEWNEMRAGDLAVHIASNQAEIAAAQALRYRIFYEEMGGIPSAVARRHKSDFDDFDPYCDHLLVLDYSLPYGREQVVGTYRLLRRSGAQKLGRFYSESEFDISTIKKQPCEILELGRSCVHENYRNRAVMQLLWRGIASYVEQYDVETMFGCASLSGTDIKSHILALSYLHHYHLAPADMRTRALPARYTEMNLLPKEDIDSKTAFSALPALIKGYLRAGGYVGHGAVIDKDCNTIDVSMAVKTNRVTEKYLQRYATYSTKYSK